MSELLNHVAESIRTRQLFRPGQRILVAVSGGVDSMVLLHLLHDLAYAYDWQLTVAHLNHQLRGRSSEADERLVRSAAARLKLPLVVGRADVRRLARLEKLSVEMAARKARHEFLAGTAAQRRIPRVALAQHADDQLELFFLRLLRGSGGEGLAGMKWRSPSPSNPKIELVRPLLDQPKAAVCRCATEEGIRYREDATNALMDFQRNRIRHELLPLLRKKYQPALDRTISRVMEIVGAEADFAAKAAGDWLQGIRSPKPEGRRLKFEKLPIAVQRRCVQMQLMGQGIAPDFELVEQLRLKPDQPVAVGMAPTPRTAVGANVRTCRPTLLMGGRSPSLSSGLGNTPVSRRTGSTAVMRPTDVGNHVCYAVRDGDGLVHLQVAAPQEFRADSMETSLQGRAGEVEFGGARIAWRICSGRGAERARAAIGRESFDADKVGAKIVLRHWQPGDRFQPIGMARSVKLQDFFTNRKVPRNQRRRLIVGATAQGEVFWVEGMRISERFKLSNGTIRRLQWRWKRL